MPTQQADIERLRARGIDLPTVEEILDGEERVSPSPPTRFSPARLDGTPTLPEPGLYFGMSDEEYHALAALSNGGAKLVLGSPMMFWSKTPWLCERKRQRDEEAAAEEKVHHVHGKAYHCRIMEGREEFDRRFVVELDPDDYPDALVHTDQIKAAIGRHTEMVPVKPCSARKDDLAAQLDQLREQNPPESGIVVGFAFSSALKVDELKDRIREYKVEQPVKPWAKVTDTMPDSGEEYLRSAVKEDWIRQLLELEPDAKVFARIQAEFLAQHPGKTVIGVETFEQIEIAAAMVERDPELRDAFRGGYAEVVLIWYCPITGVPMKAKVDYLKIKRAIDLKTVGNQRERSIENAIRFEISSYHYNMQPAVYIEGIEELRPLVRDSVGKGTVWIKQGEEWAQATGDELAWALKWASHRGDTEWLWVFQQKGDAPITRGVRYMARAVSMVTRDMVKDAKRRFRQFSETFGTDPWLDVKPIYDIHDEDIPVSATEI